MQSIKIELHAVTAVTAVTAVILVVVVMIVVAIVVYLLVQINESKKIILIGEI
jgi:hypothetical protein